MSEDRYCTDVIRAILQKMDELGITHAELGRRLNITRNGVTNMLREAHHNWSINQLHRVAHALGMELGIYIGPNAEWVARTLERLDKSTQQAAEFQGRVKDWMLACFGEAIAGDKTERNHRFLEESLELVQALGCTQSEAHKLVCYVFERPSGEPAQEVGGVMVTLAALCSASGLDMQGASERELDRIWGNIPQIRAKQAAKPKTSPLPQ